jgi:hypothetical protein
MSTFSNEHPVFSTMREIGADIHLTSHQVGKALTEAGFRDASGLPSELAFAQGVVEPYTLNANGKQAYRWLKSFVKPLARAWAERNSTRASQISTSSA